MSDNVGLSTPRGSGTSGYVQRNLAHFRPRDMGAPYARDKDFESMRHTQRKPDQGLLEHDRKREVEVKVFELRDKLEEEGVEEEEIDIQCDELRKKLLAEMERKLKGGNDRRPGGAGGPGPLRKNLKMYQVHELADAKIKESERLRQAFRISKDYEEGGHWRKQEERMKKAQERDAMPEDARDTDVRMGRGGEERGTSRRDEGKDVSVKRAISEDPRSRSRSMSRSRSRSRRRSRSRSWESEEDARDGRRRDDRYRR